MLVYRIRWFATGWSQWFVPGINDVDTKTNGRMWRYFMDHEYELVTLNMKRGDFRARSDFLPAEKQGK